MPYELKFSIRHNEVGDLLVSIDTSVSYNIRQPLEEIYPVLWDRAVQAGGRASMSTTNVIRVTGLSIAKVAGIMAHYRNTVNNDGSFHSAVVLWRARHRRERIIARALKEGYERSDLAFYWMAFSRGGRAGFDFEDMREKYLPGISPDSYINDWVALAWERGFLRS